MSYHITVTAKKYKADLAFGLSYYKVRGVSSSGKVKGSFSTAKPVYGAFGRSGLYKQYSAMQTIVQVTIVNGTSSVHSNKAMYMMGMKSINTPYSWYIIFKDKTTGKTVKTYRAVHCNTMKTNLNFTCIGKNSSYTVLCATYPSPDQVIPQSYFDNYTMVVKAPFALSSNIKSGKAFYIYCNNDWSQTDTTRWR